MKKKLYFDKKFNSNFDKKSKSYIHIIGGRIRKYTGFPFITGGLLEIKNEYKTNEINDEFKLVKISKYDRKLLDINANYRIISKATATTLNGDYPYIKLCFLEKFFINLSKKESIIQDREIKRLIITSIIITLPTSIITTISTNWITNYMKPKTESKKEISSEVKTDTITVKTHIKNR